MKVTDEEKGIIKEMVDKELLEDTYIQQGIPTTIRATSRLSVKLGDSHYTFEFSEERYLPEEFEMDYDLERDMLWDEAHKQVDRQVADVIAIRKETR